MDHLLHLDTDVVCMLSKLNSYDYIIVGSGFGGGLLAEVLAQKRKKVLLIERGGVIFSTHVLNTSRPYFSRGASNSPEGNERVYDAVKAKVQCTDTSDMYIGGPVYCVGGRSNLWGIWIPEIGENTLREYFHEAVRSDLKPADSTKEGYYKKAFDYMTDDSQKEAVYPTGNDPEEVSVADIGAVRSKLQEALSGTTFDLMPVAAQFKAPAPYKFSQGAFSTTLAIMNRMYANDPYLTVMLNTEVLAVDHVDSGSKDTKTPRKVRALKIRDPHSKEIKDLDVGHAKVILSAGTIGTASIAINSGLQLLNPLVGKGIIDHDVCYVRFAKEKDAGVTLKPLNLKTHKQVGGAECLVTVTINANFFLAGSSALIETSHYYDKVGNVLDPRKQARQQHKFDTICILFEFVAPLRDTNMVLDIPGLDPVLHVERPPITSEVQDAMDDVVKKVMDVFVDPKKTSQTPKPSIRPQQLGFGVFSHEAGTMRMDGPKGEGVVDTNLKVKGMENLWACDLSVMPVCPEANPSLTLAALSLRLAEHLEPQPKSQKQA